MFILENLEETRSIIRNKIEITCNLTHCSCFGTFFFSAYKCIFKKIMMELCYIKSFIYCFFHFVHCKHFPMLFKKFFVNLISNGCVTVHNMHVCMTYNLFKQSSIVGHFYQPHLLL